MHTLIWHISMGMWARQLAMGWGCRRKSKVRKRKREGEKRRALFAQPEPSLSVGLSGCLFLLRSQARLKSKPRHKWTPPPLQIILCSHSAHLSTLLLGVRINGALFLVFHFLVSCQKSLNLGTDVERKKNHNPRYKKGHTCLASTTKGRMAIQSCSHPRSINASAAATAFYCLPLTYPLNPLSLAPFSFPSWTLPASTQASEPQP